MNKQERSEVKGVSLRHYGPGLCECICVENHPQKVAVCENESLDGSICPTCDMLIAVGL